ncbi:MAG TPA: hypothetical protein VGL51_00485 [Solirubrobacteraceae bacterium]|jgi:hypothetical protein
MTRSLITFPLRLGLRGAGIAVESATAVAERLIGLAAQLADAVTRNGGPDLDFDGTEHREPEPEPAPTEPDRAAPQSPTAAAEPPTPTTSEPEPLADLDPSESHVSEEATLVEEVAEAGAEDGAGAEVHVAEPWDGYRELAADDVIDRIRGASSAELAAVELYELSHRSRKTVLAAVQRELARADR